MIYSQPPGVSPSVSDGGGADAAADDAADADARDDDGIVPAPAFGGDVGASGDGGSLTTGRAGAGAELRSTLEAGEDAAPKALGAR